MAVPQQAAEPGLRAGEEPLSLFSLKSLPFIWLNPSAVSRLLPLPASLTCQLLSLYPPLPFLLLTPVIPAAMRLRFMPYSFNHLECSSRGAFCLPILLYLFRFSQFGLFFLGASVMNK